LKLGYLHVVEARIAGNTEVEATEKIDFLVEIWDDVSPVLLTGGFNAASGLTAVDEEFKDRDVAIMFGRLFISNPDLVYRIKEELSLRLMCDRGFMSLRVRLGIQTGLLARSSRLHSLACR